MGCLIYNLWERIWRFSGNGNPASRQFPNFPFFFPIDRIMLLFFFSGVCFCGTGNRRKKKKINVLRPRVTATCFEVSDGAKIGNLEAQID